MFGQEPELLYEWTSLNYTWSSTEQRIEAINSGTYVVEKNVITGVKQWGDNVYVTVPRWLGGVPATLAKVSSLKDSSGSFLLEPFPSWEMNDVNNINGLRYVQSMEIDPSGRMWIIDIGRLDIFTSNPINGPAKLLVYDLNSDSLEREYIFPNSVAPFDSNFLNDIVVDFTRRVAYISDSGGPTVEGALVVYDYTTNSARRWEHPPTMAAVPSEFISINGVDYRDMLTPCDGIALTPDGNTLYYNPLTSLQLYSIPTALFRDFSTTSEQLISAITYHGAKESQTDGMTFDSNGVLYFGLLSLNGVNSWLPADGPLETSQSSLISPNTDTLQWPDTFGFDNTGNLLFTTNRLQLFFNGSMNFTGEDANFRLFRVNIGEAGSYMSNMPPFDPPTTTTLTSSTSSETDGLGLFIVLTLFGNWRFLSCLFNKLEYYLLHLFVFICYWPPKRMLLKLP